MLSMEICANRFIVLCASGRANRKKRLALSLFFNRWKASSVSNEIYLGDLPLLTEEQGGDHRDAGVSSPGNTAFRPVRCVYLSLKGISMHNHPVVYTLLNAILSVLETLTVSKKGDMLSF